MSREGPEAGKPLGRFERVALLLQVHGLQSAGHTPPRNDKRPLDALLVEAGLTQTETAWLLGKSQQAVSAAVARGARLSAGGTE
jgi:hypothetical protein